MISASMTVTGSATVHAVGPEEATGTGKLEGTIPTDIFQVVLPTSADDVFDFILDPQGLINETDGAAYGGKKFEDDATLFFKRTDDEAGYDYSSTSDAVTIINKSSVPADVILTACVLEDSLDGIVMTDDDAFTEDTSASMYLALTDGNNTIPILAGKNSSIQMTIPAAENAYEYRYDSEKDQYTYELKEDLSNIEFPKYSFQLIGAANWNGNWQEVGDVKPEVVVTWVVTRGEREGEEPRVLSENEEVMSQSSENEETEILEADSSDHTESDDPLANDSGSAINSEKMEAIPEEMPSDAQKNEEVLSVEPEKDDIKAGTDTSKEEEGISNEMEPEKQIDFVIEEGGSGIESAGSPLPTE